MRCASGSPDQLGIDGIRNRPIESPIIPKARKLDQRSISPRPPAKSENPSTSSRLPTTEPVSEPRTTSVSPSWIAIKAMISSGALPNVALRKPPIPGPVCSAACSVASPISHASGMSAAAARSEERSVADVGEVVEGDDDRPESQPREEYSTSHIA